MDIVLQKNIINQINQGDTKAFEKLYTTYYVYLCAVATKYVFHAESAQEIVNDVFLNVWNNRATLEYPAKPYLIRAVKNRSINYIQRKRIQEVPLSDIQEQLLSIQEQQINLEEQPLAYLENKEFQEKIRTAIDNLPKRCREIFIEYLYNSKSYDEIAEIYQLSNSTVRVQVKIGMTKLKEALSGLLFLLLYLYFLLLEKIS